MGRTLDWCMFVLTKVYHYITCMSFPLFCSQINEENSKDSKLTDRMKTGFKRGNNNAEFFQFHQEPFW